MKYIALLYGDPEVGAGPVPGTPEFMQATAKAAPVGHGQVEEIALAYLYCMQQTYATGSIVPVDGGVVLV